MVFMKMHIWLDNYDDPGEFLKVFTRTLFFFKEMCAGGYPGIHNNDCVLNILNKFV